MIKASPKARFPLPEFTGQVDGPWSQVHFLTPVNSGHQLECIHGPSTRVHFLTPVKLGCQKMHPSSQAVNSARELRPWTRVVETGLNCDWYWSFILVTMCITTNGYPIRTGNWIWPLLATSMQMPTLMVILCMHRNNYLSASNQDSDKAIYQQWFSVKEWIFRQSEAIKRDNVINIIFHLFARSTYRQICTTFGIRYILWT